MWLKVTMYDPQGVGGSNRTLEILVNTNLIQAVTPADTAGKKGPQAKIHYGDGRSHLVVQSVEWFHASLTDNLQEHNTSGKGADLPREPAIDPVIQVPD